VTSCAAVLLTRAPGDFPIVQIVFDINNNQVVVDPQDGRRRIITLSHLRYISRRALIIFALFDMGLDRSGVSLSLSTMDSSTDMSYLQNQIQYKI